MAKVLIKEIKPYVSLYRDSKTGIAWIENGSTGQGHSCHPNIDITGSVKGMKKLGYWKQDDRTVRSNGCIYNIDKLVVTDELDEITREYCRCAGWHNRSKPEGK
jgi:hypothetical protein